MSVEELREIDATTIPVGKLLYLIGKGYINYVNHHISEYGLNSTQLHLLFEISHESDINQERIASRYNLNKGSVARSIKKLEDKGLVKRQIDENNRRQNKLSLTESGQELINKTIRIFHDWEDSVITDDGYVEKELLQKELKEIAIRTMELDLH